MCGEERGSLKTKKCEKKDAIHERVAKRWEGNEKGKKMDRKGELWSRKLSAMIGKEVTQ